MSKKSPKPPPALQPVQTVAAQYDANRGAAADTLRMNAIDRSNPFGSATFHRDANGNPTGMNAAFSAPLQGGFDAVTGAFTGMAGLLPTTRFDSNAAAPNTDAISRTFYDKGAALLAPQFEQAQMTQDVNLTNRGLPVGSEARNIAEGNLSRQQSLALSDLASQASLLAPQEQQRLINNARSDYVMPAEMLARYGQSLGLMQGLLPTASQPQVSVAAPNYMDAERLRYAGDMNAYQAERDDYNAKMQGYGQLAKLGLGLATSPWTGPVGMSNSLLGMAGRGLFNQG